MLQFDYSSCDGNVLMTHCRLCVCMCMYSCRKSSCSDGEKRDGDDMNVDNIAMEDDLNEVRAPVTV